MTFPDFEPWWRFATAILIGALLGLEREFVQQKEGSSDFAGIRTFSLIALLGALTAYMADLWDDWVIMIAMGGLLILMTVSYFSSAVDAKYKQGITTEVAVILTFLLGALVMKGRPEVAGAVAVVTAILLSLKGELHGLIRRMDAEDIRVTLQFGLVAAVILPILPNYAFDPWGMINLFQIWMMVVLISGVGFAGYILMKRLGAGRGSKLTGAVGGLVSSTAVTLSMAARSRETPVYSLYYAQAVLLAAGIMLPRMLILAFFIYPPLLKWLGPPFMLMFLVGLMWVYYYHRRSGEPEREGEDESVELENPLAMSTAIKFGLAFAVIKIAVELLERWFGSSGVYVASTIAGLTDVDAITLSVAQLTRSGTLTLTVAATAIILAAITNTLVKAAIARSVGSPVLGRALLIAFSGIALSGLLASIVTFLVFR